MSEVGLKELLQAGVHFGHQTHRWNPKMRRYIFAERGGIYLIDLKKTLRELNRARDLVSGVVRGGGNVLFVCTKPQLKSLVRAEAERVGAFYVTERWLGGLLTNFQTIKKNIRRLKDLERGVEEDAFEFYTGAGAREARPLSLRNQGHDPPSRVGLRCGCEQGRNRRP